MRPTFTPSQQLNRRFHAEVVAPLLPRWRHSAALLGWGSDVLGYDTARSTDHGWGPRLQVFVAADDVEAVRQALDDGLPERFEGWPVRYPARDYGPPVHHVDACTLRDWLVDHLGTDPRQGFDTVDWLVTPQQLVLGVVAGAVYADVGGALADVRSRLAWFPDDVWLWLIACQWQRIGQEEPFVGRTAELGDNLGSSILAARLAREAIGLALLFARRYRPYIKWTGRAFADLPLAAELTTPLARAIRAEAFGERERALIGAYEALARAHNALGITEPLDPSVRGFWSRPYLVLGAKRFAEATQAAIGDPWLRSLPLVGSADQLADGADVLSDRSRPPALRGFYRSL